MKREGLTKVSELQGWLTNQVAGWMKERGRTVIGWEEIIMRGKVNTPVVAVIWHNVNDSIRAKEGGHKAILTPANHLYFDFPESNTPGEPQHATWMPPISLERAYSMPVNDYSPTSTTMGVQGCIWSDQFIHGTKLQEVIPIDEIARKTMWNISACRVCSPFRNSDGTPQHSVTMPISRAV